jgi:hypothetical protein
LATAGNPDGGTLLGAHIIASFWIREAKREIQIGYSQRLGQIPRGRATFDEVRRGVRALIASGDQSEQLKRFSEFGDIDIFQSGLVLRDDAGLEITDAGLSLLHSLGSSSESSLEFSSAPAPRPVDHLSGMDERLKTFDLELAMPGNNAQDDERRTAIIGTSNSAPEIGAVDPPAGARSRSRDRGRRSFGLASLAAVIAAKQQSMTLDDAISHNGLGTPRIAKMNARCEMQEALHLQSSAWYWSLPASSQPLRLDRYNP